MRAWQILLIVGAGLIGCATTPTPDPWQDIEVSQEAATRAQKLERFPAPVSTTDTTATFDIEGARSLRRFQIAAVANTDIAEAHADQIDELRKSAAHLVAAGKRQRRIADMRLEILEEERRHHAWEKLGYYLSMVLVVVGAVAL